MATRQWGGREAITHYQVQRRLDTSYGKFSLLKIKIDTGRTHQIRVHMASLGHPVVGDTLYGAPGRLQPKPVKSPGARPSGKPPFLSRTFLHAAELEISHPATSEVLSFSRPLPPELQQFLHGLEQKD